MRKLSLLLLIVISCFSARSQSSVSEPDSIMDGRSLVEFCDSFPTDKCPDKHNFLSLYENLFSPMRKESIRFFEIGILNGVSHLLWRTYFRNAEIFGIDLHDYSKVSRGTGIMTFVADQSNRSDLQRFIDTSGGNFDVILDDGGHAMDHQQVSLGYLFPEVNPGGIYIIEDIHTSLPDYYPDPFFKVDESGTNTTLFMIEWFIRKGEIRSSYMTEEEKTYLKNNIERVELHYLRNQKHSILAIFHKRTEPLK